MRLLSLSVLLGTVAIAALPDAATAQTRKTPPPVASADGVEHQKSSYYRRAPQVRGFIQRRGGYSFSVSDIANTGSDSRTRYGSVNAYRDPFSDRQTRSGPFDHGFFFDSGIAPRGGDSPYRN